MLACFFAQAGESAQAVETRLAQGIVEISNETVVQTSSIRHY